MVSLLLDVHKDCMPLHYSRGEPYAASKPPRSPSIISRLIDIMTDVLLLDAAGLARLTSKAIVKDGTMREC